MKTKTKLFICMLTLSFMTTILNTAFGATGEVTKSGSTYTGKVDGAKVYTGSKYFDAANAVINKMSSGTIKLCSGNSGPGIGDIYAIRPKSNMTLDFQGNTVTCDGDAYIVAVFADRKSNITVKNIIVRGNPRYCFWFRGCNSCTFTNIIFRTTGGLVGLRYDNSTAPASNLTVNGNIDLDGGGPTGMGHLIETGVVNGVNIGDVIARNNKGCGVLLNGSTNCTVNSVRGSYNNPDGGYATFRVANNNGSTYCGFVESRNSGRGFFSTSGSSDCTVREVDIASARVQGILIEKSSNTHVRCGKSRLNGEADRIKESTNCSITLGACTKSSIEIETGVEEESSNNLSIYPNPLSGNILNVNTDIKAISISNTTGQVVYQKDNVSAGQLDLGNLAKGVYIIRIDMGNDVNSIKMIKR